MRFFRRTTRFVGFSIQELVNKLSELKSGLFDFHVYTMVIYFILRNSPPPTFSSSYVPFL